MYFYISTISTIFKRNKNTSGFKSEYSFNIFIEKLKYFKISPAKLVRLN